MTDPIRDVMVANLLDYPSASMPGLIEFGSEVPDDVTDAYAIVDRIIADERLHVALSTPPADDVREATVMQNARYLLDVLDGIPGPPFEMAVLDAHGRVGIAYADEDAVLGIQRLAYEDESNNPATVREEDFPMIRLVPASQSGGRS